MTSTLRPRRPSLAAVFLRTFAVNDTHKNPEIPDFELIRSLVQQAHREGTKVLTLAGGEASERDVYRVLRGEVEDVMFSKGCAIARRLPFALNRILLSRLHAESSVFPLAPTLAALVRQAVLDGRADQEIDEAFAAAMVDGRLTPNERQLIESLIHERISLWQKRLAQLQHVPVTKKAKEAPHGHARPRRNRAS